MTLEEMKSVNPETVDKNLLRQRSEVKVNSADSREKKIADYIRQIGNPYCYLEGKTVVKISFSSDDTTIEDCMRAYFNGL